MHPLLVPQPTEFVICISIYIRAPQRHITSPSEKSRPETWHGNSMGKATPVWQLNSSHRCHQICNVSRSANKPRRWISMLTNQGWFNLLIYASFTRTTTYRVCNLYIYLYPCSAPSQYQKQQMIVKVYVLWVMVTVELLFPCYTALTPDRICSKWAYESVHDQFALIAG